MGIDNRPFLPKGEEEGKYEKTNGPCTKKEEKKEKCFPSP